MGYTGFTKRIIETVINTYHPKSVIDLGSQQDYDQPDLPAPYISGWYKDKSIFYECIDLNGENDAWYIDLSKPFDNIRFWEWKGQYLASGYELLVDAGTSEHVSLDGKFSWEAIYNCWVIKHMLLRNGCIMVNENPKSGSWPGHGFNYYTKDFYIRLQLASDYHIVLLEEHPAMENRVDGWNIACVMQKRSSKFPSFQEFQQLGIKSS